MDDHQLSGQQVPCDQTIVKQCQKWVESIIVRFNICPFAKAELEQQTIDYHVVPQGSIESYVEAIVAKCQLLDHEPAISTSLVIYPDPELDYDTYLELLAISEQVLIVAGYDGTYQLASFHPDYCFDECAQDDAANYTNRAPYPVLHLIREAQITKVLADFLKPEQIPHRNIEFTRRKGHAKMAAALGECYKI